MKKPRNASNIGSDTLVTIAAKARLTPSALNTTITWLAEQLVSQEHAKLGQGGHTQNQVPLRSVFVDLPVSDSLNVEPQQASRVFFLEKLLSAVPLNLRQACEPREARVAPTADNAEENELNEQKQGAVSRRNLELEFGATLLVGGPGQGKSTLGQLACQLHRAALLKPLENQLTSAQCDLVRSFEPATQRKRTRSPLSLPQSPFLPLQIALPDFAAWLTREQPSPTRDQPPALLRFLADLPSAKTCGLRAGYLLALASHMPSLLVLDGFDEVGATQDRERLVDAAREFLLALGERNAFAQVIATTRPQGYAGELAQIGIPLAERYLAPLLRDEALEYAKKLVEAKINDVDLRTKTLDRLHEAAAEPATERLLTTPLQVTILTALVQQLGRAPRERWNLFWRYFSYTFDREIERDTYASRLLSDHRSHIEQIHARVALLLQVEAERDGGASARMPRSRLEDVIEAVLSEDEVSEVERKELVHSIAIAAEQRLVFLVEPEPGSFGFEIRSLQEFMAAWALTSGRDKEIEARLQQVAKAPMFRNVALFVASRLFSEGSPLRDILADRVCGSLDDDPVDELARLTCAGGVLALETLEEGAVLSQPKRARALMERAVRLLSLPPGREHSRLARAVNNDTELVLKESIEQCLGARQNERQYNPRSAWICLVEATNRGDSWAMQVGANFWPRLAEPASLIRDCAVVGIPLGLWISTKIQDVAEKVPPENFSHLPTFSKGSEISPNWVAWLVTVYDDDRRWRRRQRASVYFNVVEPRSQAELGTAPIATVPVAWGAWVAAARFEIAPNARHLATALKVIAGSLPIHRWPALQWVSSWPLAVCLGAASSPKELRQFAKQLLSGDLGDMQEWCSAQEEWMKKIDPLAVFDAVGELAPWSLRNLKRAPPLLAFPYWSFGEWSRGRKSHADTVAILEKANQCFHASRSGNIKQVLARLCLCLVQRLVTKIPASCLNLTEWLAETPKEIGYLVPRPKSMARAEWLKLLDASPIPTHSSVFSYTDYLIESLADSNAHPVVLRLAVISLTLHSPHIRFASSRLKSVVAELNHEQAKTPTARADLAILQIYVADLPPESDADLISDIAIAAVSTPSLWNELLNALRVSRLPVHRLSALLANVLVKIGAVHPQAGTAIKLLRDALQTRKSGLENHAIWNRLALPLPYPQPPLHSGLEHGIPSRPIRIQTLEVRDLRGLHHLKLNLKSPLDEKGQWVVILGPNGIGKTTLLGSLALALRNMKDPTIWPKGAFANSWQRIAGSDDDRSIDTQVTVKLGDGTEHKTLIRSNGSINISQSPEQDRPRLFPLFAYGCRRGSSLGGAARHVDLTDDDGPEIATLFDEGASLIHAETWLLQLDGDAPKNARSRAIFNAVIEAMRILLDVDSVDVLDRKVWVTERNRPKIPFSSLSDGYLTSAGWFIDLVARWLTLAERYNESIENDFLARMRGLVLIDEIDLHLHPSWQIEIITRTRRLLPQMSFIVTTHNPLTLVGAKAEEIWILSTENGRVNATCGVEAPVLLTGGQIYRRYFDIEDIYPDGLGRSLRRYSFLSGYSLRNNSEQAELESLETQLREAGLEPGWEVVPRTEVQPESPALTAPKKPPSRRSKGGK